MSIIFDTSCLVKKISTDTVIDYLGYLKESWLIFPIETRKREANALLLASKRIKMDRIVIITKDEEETVWENGVKIEVVPIRKWLCDFL